jgi:hypothetical protein
VQKQSTRDITNIVSPTVNKHCARKSIFVIYLQYFPTSCPSCWSTQFWIPIFRRQCWTSFCMLRCSLYKWAANYPQWLYLCKNTNTQLKSNVSLIRIRRPSTLLFHSFITFTFQCQICCSSNSKWMSVDIGSTIT